MGMNPTAASAAKSVVRSSIKPGDLRRSVVMKSARKSLMEQPKDRLRASLVGGSGSVAKKTHRSSLTKTPGSVTKTPGSLTKATASLTKTPDSSPKTPTAKTAVSNKENAQESPLPTSSPRSNTTKA